MNLNYTATQFQKASDIQIPEIFFRRYKSGIPVIDDLFEEGILPGSSITMCAAAGCGKTTLLLQLLEGLHANGYNVAYTSGEESDVQLAFTCKRINVRNVSIANLTDVDALAEQMEHFDCLVVDSFQALTTEEKKNSRELEKYAVSTLSKAAKENECTLFFIMHLTKDGKLKGSTLVPHTVDVNMEIHMDPDVSEDCRKIFFRKNRFGPLNELSLYIGAGGYDFGTPVVIPDDVELSPKSSKNNQKQEMFATIMALDEPPILNAGRVMDALNVDYMKSYNLLRELVLNNKLLKFGKGKTATYKHV